MTRSAFAAIVLVLLAANALGQNTLEIIGLRHRTAEQVLPALRALLEPNHEVIGMVHDGSKALDEVRRLKPDLVLLDLLMPGKLGLDVCREIKAFIFLILHS